MTQGVGNSFVTQAGGRDARGGRQFRDADGRLVTQGVGNSFVRQGVSREKKLSSYANTLCDEKGAVAQGVGNSFVMQGAGISFVTQGVETVL